MPQELSTEYDFDIREYPKWLESIITEQYPPTNVRDVEEVIYDTGFWMDRI